MSSRADPDLYAVGSFNECMYSCAQQKHQRWLQRQQQQPKRALLSANRVNVVVVVCEVPHTPTQQQQQKQLHASVYKHATHTHTQHTYTEYMYTCIICQGRTCACYTEAAAAALPRECGEEAAR
uniref:Uncharacterized protein n=1 Tax=Trichogramma kaykai TaxID=54128 RepID=A0ABD2WAH9_9HYME